MRASERERVSAYIYMSVHIIIKGKGIRKRKKIEMNNIEPERYLR